MHFRIAKKAVADKICANGTQYKSIRNLFSLSAEEIFGNIFETLDRQRFLCYNFKVNLLKKELYIHDKN